MSEKEPSDSKRLSIATIAFLIVIGTFGLGNVIDNLVQIGLAAIPSWFLVGLLYFLPLALILSEFASDTRETGGIYSYMVRGLGEKWAFVGTWSYFVSNLFYLQTSFSILPIRLSLAFTGGDIFENSAFVLPLLAVLICLLLTWLASRGVGFFSKFAGVFGTATLVLVAALILVPFTMVITGGHEPVTDLSLQAMAPEFDLVYFSTFAWLLFAVSGAEIAAPYVNQTRNPSVNFPRAILLTTLLIAGAYLLASIAVALIMPLEQLTKATGLFEIWIYWAALVGLPGELIAHICMSILTLTFLISLIVWAESPLRVMFAEVPRDSFPRALTRRAADGTHHQALWTQAMVVSVLILIPLFSIFSGTEKSEAFISLLNDLASLSLVVPYMFVALAYIRARRNGMDAPFKMTRSTPLAVAIGVLVLVVSAAGYLGAGLYAMQSDPVDWIYVAVVYAGPLIMIGLGLLLRAWSIRTIKSMA